MYLEFVEGYMKEFRISEYIAELQRLLAEHGDLICMDADGEPVTLPEVEDGVLVLCEIGYHR